ncbi:amidohydrolase family protein [Nonomuraea indica]|uniref:amidohydrolase family protein n=1 Tax=Nonomuraea indica TaxID=1581193 RepID=UPI000C7BBF2C|nr:hypothetical protein [Nonomuraea indica]
MPAQRARPIFGRRAPAPVVVHSAPLVLPLASDPVRDGAVAVRGERVLQVAARGDLLARFPGAGERRWPGMIVPGLVDAASVTSAAEALAHGVTTRARVVTGGSSRGAAADPAEHAALPGVGYVEVTCEDEDAWDRRGRDAVVTAMRESDRPHIVGIAARTPDPVVLEDIAVLARTFGLRLLVDLGARSVAALDEAGVLGPHCHATCDRPLDPGERKLLRLRDTVVAVGAAAGPDDVLALLDEGNPLALCTTLDPGAGTGDGTSSGTGDGTGAAGWSGLLGQARGIRERARALGPRPRGLDRRLVEAATLGGARALGMHRGAGRIGCLVPGGRADFAVFDARGRYPYSALLARPDCLATVVGGRIRTDGTRTAAT